MLNVLLWDLGRWLVLVIKVTLVMVLFVKSTMDVLQAHVQNIQVAERKDRGNMSVFVTRVIEVVEKSVMK